MRRNSGKTLAAAHAAIETAAASAPHASPSPGCCTLTASARPSATAVARWTCARLADATGVSSKLAKSASGGEPSSEMIIFLWGVRAGWGGGGGCMRMVGMRMVSMG